MATPQNSQISFNVVKKKSIFQLPEIIKDIFEIQKADKYIIKLKQIPRVFTSWQDLKQIKEKVTLTQTQFLKITQKIKDVKMICDSLLDVRARSYAYNSLTLGKKFAFRLQRNKELRIEVQQIDLVLLKLMPDPKSNLGTCQIFYYLRAAINQWQKISNITIQNKLKTYKQISIGGFSIFGLEEPTSIQEDERDFEKFEQFCEALRNLQMEDSLICDYLDILLAIILLGGVKEYTGQKQIYYFGGLKMEAEQDISDTLSTFDETGEIITIKLSKLLKLHSQINEVEEIKDMENQQTAKIYLQCQDKLRGSYNYLFQQLYIWTLQRIHEQNPVTDKLLYDVTIFEKQTPMISASEKKICYFVDFLQNFSIDYVKTNLCQQNTDLKQQVSDIASWFENQKTHTSDELLKDLQKYDILKTNNQLIRKLRHSFGDVSYEFSDFHRSNYYQLNEKIQDFFLNSENHILKMFKQVNGDMMQTMITSIIKNLKSYILIREPTNNYNDSNPSSTRFKSEEAETPCEQLCLKKTQSDP